jgi:hypothetical protein
MGRLFLGGVKSKKSGPMHGVMLTLCRIGARGIGEEWLKTPHRSFFLALQKKNELFRLIFMAGGRLEYKEQTYESY